MNSIIIPMTSKLNLSTTDHVRIAKTEFTLEIENENSVLTPQTSTLS